MEPSLYERFAAMENENLLEQYYRHGDEYNPEARGIMAREIEKRGIRREESPGPDQPVTSGVRASFVPFDHSFSQTDLILAAAILRDQSIPFFVDEPVEDRALPLENESLRRYAIHVQSDRLPDARALIDERFEECDGLFVARYSSPAERIRAFNFHEVAIHGHHPEERCDLEFSPEERRLLAGLFRRLVGEADRVEQQQERTLFYYDSLEEMAAQIEGGACGFLLDQVLCILEVLQVYCREPDFPPDLLQTGSVLLDFIEREGSVSS